jgi:hypothetical protein
MICNDSTFFLSFFFYLKQNFKANVITKTPKFKGKMLPAVESYVDVCVEVLWLMSIQVPSMALEWPEPNSPFDNEKYIKQILVVQLRVIYYFIFGMQ